MASTPAVLSADEKLARIIVKVKRAKKHIADLNNACAVFIASNPYVVSAKTDPEGRKATYYMASVAAVPEELAVIAADAIHNLRCALDHLAHQLFLMGPNARADAEFNFPVFNKAKDFHTFLKRAVKSLRQDAIEAFRNVEPYKGGKGHELWVLNRLNNIDKHRLLVTVGSSYGGVNLGRIIQRDMQRTMKELWQGTTVPKMDFFISPADNLCPLKAGDELLIDAVDPEVDKKLEFRFTIAFNEPQIAEAKPMLETLQHFLDLVSGTVTSFKSCLS